MLASSVSARNRYFPTTSRAMVRGGTLQYQQSRRNTTVLQVLLAHTLCRSDAKVESMVSGKAVIKGNHLRGGKGKGGNRGEGGV